MIAFHQTRFGHELLGRDVPRFLAALDRLATALERIGAALDRMGGDVVRLADTVHRPPTT